MITIRRTKKNNKKAKLCYIDTDVSISLLKLHICVIFQKM